MFLSKILLFSNTICIRRAGLMDFCLYLLTPVRPPQGDGLPNAFHPVRLLGPASGCVSKAFFTPAAASCWLTREAAFLKRFPGIDAS